jgi:flagellar export protein FliJ
VASVFDTLTRVRELEERRALAEQLEAERIRETWDQAVVQLEEALTQAHQMGHGSAGMLAACHAWSLKVEPERRGRQAERAEAQVRAEGARQRLERAAVARRSVELLAEAHTERMQAEARRAEARALDEIGAQRWSRRAA